ncbi:MAG TPA: hypothetical protein P5205_18715 [Candidatus Paceibacterota bacterium]|nr:hypothetical protein [Verrucomicrobiota bacterium]HSA12395.1 hypothetical protein [Candidatus Paceibacterota bacterium]
MIALVVLAGSDLTQAAAIARAKALPSFRTQPDQPNILTFAPASARFIRLFIHEAEAGQPCIDELEIYGAEGSNLALASRGARASASSCLPGHAIHQVPHLNDGRYGNSHSWIAAGTSGEWAQIELPAPALVKQVVFSRDREGTYRDRLPSQFEIQLSLDGHQWKTVCVAGAGIPLPNTADWGALLHYAFLCEQETWSRVDTNAPVDRVLKQMEALLERIAAKGVDVTAERRAWTNLQRRIAQTARPPAGSTEAGDAEYLEARMAKRRLFLRDPDLLAVQRILFVARHPYEPSHNYSDILDAQWRPGGGVCVLEIPRHEGRFDPAAGKVRKLFEAGDGVARDAAASIDGKRIYFGYRAAPDGYYHIRAVNADGSGSQQLTDGPFHDYYPCPLPDGGIACISTRCKARFLCWRPQAFVLFRMEADGTGIKPLSFANLSEWAPSVMRDGRILWTRSEYLDKGADFGHTLWAIRPDGSHPELVFGNNTLNCYVNAQEVPGTGELCCTLISHGGDLNGPIALIDPGKGRYNPAAITNITPDAKPYYHMDWAKRECFRDPVPIARDYFLVSHAPQEHFALYAIDRFGNRELLYLDPGISSMCPTPLRPRPMPPLLATNPNTGGSDSAGQFFVADVHQGLEPAVPRGRIKYLRVCEEVRADLQRLPNGEYRQDHPPFEDFYASPTHLVCGPHGWPSYVAKASLGLVPVEQDGSASFYAPAGKVLYFQALDEQLNEVQRMRSVVQLQPGERRSCLGCHEDRAMTGGARATAALQHEPRRIEPPPWGAVPFAYEKVVQPVWDTHCVRCHDASHERKLDLTGTLGPDRVPASYRTLITQGLVHYFDYTWGREHNRAEPLTFGTTQSKLWQVLQPGHHDVKLTRDEMHRVKCWTDLNCPLWPDYIQRDLRPTLARTSPPER